MVNSQTFLRISGLFLLSMIAVGPSLADDSLPDPRSLLAAIEKDRLALKSGRLELNVSFSSPKRPQEGLAQMRIVINFDGEKRRTDRSQRVLKTSWLRAAPGSAIDKQQQIVELMGSREAVVREGLGFWYDYQEHSIYDGKEFLSHTQGTGSAYVSDRKKAPALSAFDPRILGLSSILHPSETVPKSFAPRPNEVVTLVGRDVIGGASAWHVLIGGAGDGRDIERHFWVEPLPGHRVFKVGSRGKFGRSEVVSEYGRVGDGDCLPVRVMAHRYDRDGVLDQEMIIDRTKAEFDVPTDPKLWTFAGLGMPVGLPISDLRLNRVIGYWDGQAISEQPVPEVQEVHNEPKPNIAKLLEIARKDRTGQIAIEALAEMARSAPASPEAGETLKLIAEFHPEMKGIGEIGLRLIQAQPEDTERLFRSVLARNPVREDQGLACFGLAEILKNRSEQIGLGEPSNAAALEAEWLFDRVISSYSNVRKFLYTSTLGEEARIDLKELRTLGVGKMAPEIRGEDLDGTPLSLQAYRGKVVVVVFWATTCGPCLKLVPHERELVTRMKGKPFALLGVNGDDNRKKAKATSETLAMTWPSWWQGRVDSSISTDWGARGWPRVYVLDSKGVIRFKNLSNQALDKAVEALMKEAEHG